MNSPASQRFSFSVALCALFLATFLPGASSWADADHEFPLASTGDIWFQVDHAGFLGPNEEVVEEYYFRITNNQIEFTEEDEGLSGKLFVKLKFRDADDRELSEAGQRFEFKVPTREVADSPDHAQLLVLREALDPRAHSVEVTVEDLSARKRGLLYMFTGKRKNGRAVGSIDPPPFVNEKFGASDIQFAWEVHEGEGEAVFEKHGLNVIPNPSRSFGLLQPRLSAYYEVYDRRDKEDGSTTYFVHHELEDAAGNIIRSKPDTVQSDSGEWIKVISFDLSHLVTGAHILRAVIEDPNSQEEAVTERSFSLLWKSKFWEMTEQDLLDEARVLFTEKEYERFKNMSAGDRANYAEKFWADADPNPISARNELREEFLRRVNYANRQFSTHVKGMLTDRGRLYIRFGEPDEIQEEVMPTQGTQLDQQVQDLVDENPSASLLATNDAVDNRSYEVWIYTRQGSPLFPEREQSTPVTGLRFVFVDETGTGDYILRYSSDFIGYK